MRKKLIVVPIFACIIFMLTISAVAYGSNNYERVIITFNDGVKPGAQDVLVTKHGHFIKHLHLINAAVALVPSGKKVNLAKEKGVLSVEDDIKVFALINQAPERTSTQILPWGISRINANLAWPVSEANGIRVGVIDSGIQLNHPDLVSNIKGGFNAINHRKSADDDNGHGTHVAGIIAAENNEIGVVGVAPKAQLYAVKVLDNTGSGRISDVVEGIQWCMDNHIQVVNMSFGASSYSKALHRAIKKAYSGGLIMVAAAGNNGPGANTVSYPAKFYEVIAVSATNENDIVTSWSSRGPEVDIAAPGVGIYSTYKGSTYEGLNGTSMAAPHVTGAAALKLQQNPTLTPSQALGLLKQTANSLPNMTPEEQGAGLVDAYNLISVK